MIEELFEPGDRFGIQVIGRLVQQQHVRFGKQQAAQGDAPAFAAGQLVDFRIPVRQAQGIGGHFQFAVDLPAVRRIDLVLQLALFFEQSSHFVVVHWFSETFADLVETLHETERVGETFLDDCSDGLLRIQHRFLREVADFDAGLRSGFALEFLVDAAHDAQQCRFSRAVQAEHTDLGAGEEAQGDVAQDMPLRRHDLRHLVHCKYVLGHGWSPVIRRMAIIPEAAGLANFAGKLSPGIRLLGYNTAPSKPPAETVNV